MAKTSIKYACAECGYTAGRWFGKCPGCNAFGTLIEEGPPDAAGVAAPKALLRLVDVDAAEAERIGTGVDELDRVLGGGLVPASLVLVGAAGILAGLVIASLGRRAPAPEPELAG